jgi:hypothetical protein
MPTFEERIHAHFDTRIRTLGRIKTRSLGADSLTLTALNVLVYAQLEGGIKDLAGCVIHDLNARRPPFGDINPGLLRWRNPGEVVRLRSMVDFNMIALHSPFSSALAKRFKVNAINRRNELNQMGWEAIKQVYGGFGLNPSTVLGLRTKLDEIVNDRNEAAHYGVLPGTLGSQMEHHIRDNVFVVENVLTDFSLQILPYFSSKMHLR